MRRKYVLGLFIWFLATLFYFFEFFLRIFLGTIAQDILHDFNLSPRQFSLLGSSYYFAFAIMQFPVGLIFDRFGIRFPMTIAIFLCVLGTLGFSISHTFIEAFISRFFMGLGSAFAFVALIVLAYNWFPKKHLGFMAGLAQLLGAIGPLFAGAPLVFILQKMNNDWRLFLQITSYCGLFLTILFGFFLRDKPEKQKKHLVLLENQQKLSHKLFSLLKKSQVWFIALFSGITYVCLPLLGAYWGTLYMQARGFSLASSSFSVSMMWIGLALGSPLFGKFSDLIKQRKSILFLCAFIGLVSSSTLLILPKLPILIFSILFFLIGVAGSGQSLAFATIAEIVPKKMRATALAINNTSITIFGGLLPPITGILINISMAKSSTHLLVESNYIPALFMIPVLFSLGCIISLFLIKETYIKEHGELVMTAENKK